MPELLAVIAAVYTIQKRRAQQVLSSERCAVCEGSAEVNGKIVGSKTLRSLELLGADGNRRTISEWAEQQEKLNSAGVAGPIFISIGDAEKLNKFLELNPQVPREKSFVDDSSDFAAYQSAGFGKIGETEVKKVQMAKPELTGQQWFTYARNVMALSPVPKDLKFGEFPEGVLRLGGTFVLDGDKVIYAWADPIPGQHPAVEDVIAAAL
eukprot:gene5481-6644_t